MRKLLVVLLFVASSCATTPEPSRPLPETYLECRKRVEGVKTVYICWEETLEQ